MRRSAAPMEPVERSRPSTARARTDFSDSREEWKAWEEDLSWLARERSEVVRSSWVVRSVVSWDSVWAAVDDEGAGSVCACGRGRGKRSAPGFVLAPVVVAVGVVGAVDDDDDGGRWDLFRRVGRASSGSGLIGCVVDCGCGCVVAVGTSDVVVVVVVVVVAKGAPPSSSKAPLPPSPDVLLPSSGVTTPKRSSSSSDSDSDSSSPS